MFDGAPQVAPDDLAQATVISATVISAAPTQQSVRAGAAYNAVELAAMEIPGMPGSERGLQLRATRENWPSRPRAGIGGGVEYPLLTLPASLKNAILKRLARALEPQPAPPPAPIVTAEIADWQRDIRDARAAICAEVDRLAALHGSRGRKSAVAVIAAAAAAGELSPALQALAASANNKDGKRNPRLAKGGRALSARTIERWLTDRDRGGVAALTPRNGGRQVATPGWLPALMQLYRRPSKPPLNACLRDLPGHWAPSKPGEKYPSASTARMWLGKQAAQERNKGRLGPRAMLALQAFRRRDTSMLAPLDVVVADGHTFRAFVAHPVTGKRFQPEVMAVLDVATSKVVGWSAGVAESTQVVMDGIRHAVTSHGNAAILYTDNGSGFCNDAVSDAVVGFYARIGLTHERAEPGRAQARGKIERPNRSLWRDAAKKLPSYCGADMDREAGKSITKRIDKDIKERGASAVMLGWDEFLTWLGSEVENYNNRPHRSLPKIAEGKTSRHMTPSEAWDAKCAEHRKQGWDLIPVSAEEADDLFRPHVIRACRRGEVQLPWGRYFAQALVPHHGDDVIVAYEVQDGSCVWVKTLDGRLICTAARDGNVTAYMPASKVDHARQSRAAGQLRRMAGKAADIRDEACGAGLIDAVATPTLDLTADEMAAAEAELVKLSRGKTVNENERPNFGDDAAWAAWLAAHPEQATDADRGHLADLLAHRATREWWRAEGLDLDVLASIAA